MEKLSWNFKELRDHVRRTADDPQSVLNLIASLDWSDRLFRYHFCTARDTIRAVPLDDDPSSVISLDRVFRSAEQNDHELLVVRANVLACIHTVRNAYDHLAQLCNATLLAPPIPVERCDLHRLHKRLPPSDLRDELDALTGSHWFKYVSAYSNASKHRALVQQGLHLSFADGVLGVRVDGFTHDQDYPPYMVGDLLEGVLGVKNQIIACGCALNRLVLSPSG